MSMFCSKTLKSPPRLSDIFRENREKNGWDIRSVYFRTHIPSKYISALEAGDFETLPKAKAHRVAYVKEYANALGLDLEECLQHFYQEEGLKDVTLSPGVGQKRRLISASLSILIRNFIIGASAVGLAAFLILQVKNILQPPTLTITNPADGYVTSEKLLTLEGSADSGATVKLNGQEVTLDKTNHFSVKLDLVNGLNTLEIEARKKHGKTTKKIVNVIVKQSVIGMNN